jgi:hypothetical protein
VVADDPGVRRVRDEYHQTNAGAHHDDETDDLLFHGSLLSSPAGGPLLIVAEAVTGSAFHPVPSCLLAVYRRRYQQIIDAGTAANPSPPGAAGRGWTGAATFYAIRSHLSTARKQAINIQCQLRGLRASNCRSNLLA